MLLYFSIEDPSSSLLLSTKEKLNIETAYHMQLIHNNAAEQAHEIILEEAGDELVRFLNRAHQHPRGLRVDGPKGAPAAIEALDIPACTFTLSCALLAMLHQ